MPPTGERFGFVFFGGRAQLEVEFDRSYDLNNLHSAQQEVMIVPRSFYGKALQEAATHYC